MEMEKQILTVLVIVYKMEKKWMAHIIKSMVCMVYAKRLWVEMKGCFVMLICKHAENAFGDKTGTKQMRSFVTYHIQKPKNSRSVVAIYVVDNPTDEVC